jgi:circadian clock protein KaiB
MNMRGKKMEANKDSQKALRKAVEKRKNQKYVLSLYVSGFTARSTLAIENIQTICKDHLQGHYELEVIDIFQQPEAARKEQIIAAPTLIKKLPLPLRKFIGDLSNTERILVGLEIKEKN